MNDLFMNSGAMFSECKQYRYRLWRIWDDSKVEQAIMALAENSCTFQFPTEYKTHAREVSASLEKKRGVK